MSPSHLLSLPLTNFSQHNRSERMLPATPEPGGRRWNWGLGGKRNMKYFCQETQQRLTYVQRCFPRHSKGDRALLHFPPAQCQARQRFVVNKSTDRPVNINRSSGNAAQPPCVLVELMNAHTDNVKILRHGSVKIPQGAFDSLKS